MGFQNSPDSPRPGSFEAYGGEAEPDGEPLFATDLILQLVGGFHPPRLRTDWMVVQKTGRIPAFFAPLPPEPHRGSRSEREGPNQSRRSAARRREVDRWI